MDGAAERPRPMAERAVVACPGWIDRLDLRDGMAKPDSTFTPTHIDVGAERVPRVDKRQSERRDKRRECDQADEPGPAYVHGSSITVYR
jgi:hypothetical protein